MGKVTSTETLLISQRSCQIAHRPSEVGEGALASHLAYQSSSTCHFDFSCVVRACSMADGLGRPRACSPCLRGAWEKQHEPEPLPPGRRRYATMSLSDIRFLLVVVQRTRRRRLTGRTDDRGVPNHAFRHQLCSQHAALSGT
jgi:hypothetical protein